MVLQAHYLYNKPDILRAKISVFPHQLLLILKSLIQPILEATY